MSLPIGTLQQDQCIPSQRTRANVNLCGALQGRTRVSSIGGLSNARRGMTWHLELLPSPAFALGDAAGCDTRHAKALAWRASSTAAIVHELHLSARGRSIMGADLRAKASAPRSQ